jgi:hypothetical protein
MSILSGKPINKLSYFSQEEELLLEPFTEFRIAKIKKNQMKRYPDIEGADSYPFTVY